MTLLRKLFLHLNVGLYLDPYWLSKRRQSWGKHYTHYTTCYAIWPKLFENLTIAQCVFGTSHFRFIFPLTVIIIMPMYAEHLTIALSLTALGTDEHCIKEPISRNYTNWIEECWFVKADCPRLPRVTNINNYITKVRECCLRSERIPPCGQLSKQHVARQAFKLSRLLQIFWCFRNPLSWGMSE